MPHSRFTRRILASRLVLAVLLAALVPGCTQSPDACGVTPAARNAYDRLPLVTDPDLTLSALESPRRALLEQYPRDLFVEMALQDAMRSPLLAERWEAALERYRKIADRDAGELLEARLIFRLNPQRARDLVDAVLDRSRVHVISYDGQSCYEVGFRHDEPRLLPSLNILYQTFLI